MRYLAIVLNVVLLGTAIFLVVKNGFPGADDRDFFLAIILFASPIASLMALLLNQGDTLLGLYFKRKALEERKKIDQLEVR